jgi:hypothetical protein
VERNVGEGIFDGLESCEDTSGWRGERQLARFTTRSRRESPARLIDGAE